MLDRLDVQHRPIAGVIFFYYQKKFFFFITHTNFIFTSDKCLQFAPNRAVNLINGFCVYNNFGIRVLVFLSDNFLWGGKHNRSFIVIKELNFFIIWYLVIILKICFGRRPEYFLGELSLPKICLKETLCASINFIVPHANMGVLYEVFPFADYEVLSPPCYILGYMCAFTFANTVFPASAGVFCAVSVRLSTITSFIFIVSARFCGSQDQWLSSSLRGFYYYTLLLF